MKESVDFHDPLQAESFVKAELAEQPERLAHVLTVAEKVRQSAEEIAAAHPDIPINPQLAYCAALLHDIGYAPCAKITDFHPYDGYVYLKNQGFEDLAQIIVGHSSSPEEAQLCGHAAIEASTCLEAQLITYCDMQVKQGGEKVSFEGRLADIVSRYGEDSPIARANMAAKVRINAIFEEIEGLLCGKV